MHFLGFVSDWLSQVPDALGGAIVQGAKTIFFALDTIVYKLIINLYDMFNELCTVRLLSNDLLQAISERIGLILGLVMLFFVILSFIQMLLNPDYINDKEKGAISIIKKTIIVIVMLGVSNFVFDVLYYVQRTVVESNIISRLLLPYSIETTINNDATSGTNAVMDNEKFGALLSEELLMTFYRLEEFSDDSEMSSEDQTVYAACKATVNAFRTQIVNYNRFDLGYNCLNEEVTVAFKVDSSNVSDPVETSIVDFNWLLSAISGIVVAYFLLMYCIKVGVRMVQLMFLEIISPMAFVSYLSPKKDTMFNKWGKVYFATYIDVFIRIAIINFIFFLIATLFSTNNSTTSGLVDLFSQADDYTRGFYTVVIILALLMFAKKAPELLKELLPASASKLSFGASMKEVLELPKAAKIGAGVIGGAVGGAAIGLLGGGIGGMAGGFLKGGFSGFSGQGLTKTAINAWKNQSKANKAYADAKANGASWFGYQMAHLQQNLGMRTAYDSDLVDYNVAKSYNDSFKAAKSEAGSEVDKNSSHYYFSNSGKYGDRSKVYSLTELKYQAEKQGLSEEEHTYWIDKYNESRKMAQDQALRDGGAINEGRYLFDSTGALHKSSDSKVDLNATINTNMEYVANSDIGRQISGDRLARAKEANKHYDATIVNHGTDEDIKRHRANVGK